MLNIDVVGMVADKMSDLDNIYETEQRRHHDHKNKLMKQQKKKRRLALMLGVSSGGADTRPVSKAMGIKLAAKLTKEQDDDIRTSFNEVDIDGSGTVDAGEFEDAMRTLGVSLNKKEVIGGILAVPCFGCDRSRGSSRIISVCSSFFVCVRV